MLKKKHYKNSFRYKEKKYQKWIHINDDVGLLTDTELEYFQDKLRLITKDNPANEMHQCTMGIIALLAFGVSFCNLFAILAKDKFDSSLLILSLLLVMLIIAEILLFANMIAGIYNNRKYKKSYIKLQAIEREIKRRETIPLLHRHHMRRRVNKY